MSIDTKTPHQIVLEHEMKYSSDQFLNGKFKTFHKLISN